MSQLFLNCDDVNECEEGMSGCSQLCENTDGGFSCSCNDGYRLNETDQMTCSDINECEVQNGGCHHLCVNEIGSYHCECQPGFSFDQDTGQSCLAERCPPLVAPKNGGISGCPADEQTTGAQCRFECNQGFSLVGSSVRLCTPQETWTGFQVVCEPMKCDSLIPPTNGKVLSPCDNDYASSCMVLCNFGYKLTGPPQQTCDFNSEGMLDWTNPQTCQAICEPNPCLHGGRCTMFNTHEDFECICDGTGYSGPTCNRGIVNTPSIPILDPREVATFSISANPDTELVLTLRSSFQRLLVVTPSTLTFTPSKNQLQFSVRGRISGSFNIWYELSGPDAINFNTPSETPVFVQQQRAEEEINAYFRAVQNEIGFLNESCCLSLVEYQECPMSDKMVSFLSTCRWSGSSTITSSNGVVFAKVNRSSLSLPLSVSGIQVEYDGSSFVGTSLPQSSSFTCPPCLANRGNNIVNTDIPLEFQNCYYYNLRVSDTEDFLNTNSLALTFVHQIQPLFPSWVVISFSPLMISREQAIYSVNDYTTRLVEKEDVESVEGCNNIIAENPGLHSVLSYNQPTSLNLNVDGDNVSYTSTNTEFICLAVNLCEEMDSPLFVGIPQELKDTIKLLPVLKPYANKDMRFSIDSVTLYNTRRNVTVSGLYWNGSQVYTPAPHFVDLKLTSQSLSKVLFFSAPNKLVHVQLEASGSLLYHFDNNNVRSGVFEGNIGISMVAQISRQSFLYSLSSSKPVILYTSGDESEICSQGLSLKTTYKPGFGQEFFSELFSLEHGNVQCDMDVFINMDHSLSFHGVSMYISDSSCLRLQLDRLTFPQMTHTFYFAESRDFHSSCVPLPDIDFGLSNPILSIRSSLQEVPPVPLGTLMTLLPGPDSVDLSIDYAAKNPRFLARMHSVNVSILGTLVNTPIDIYPSSLRFTSEVVMLNGYTAQVTVRALTNVSWERLNLFINGVMGSSFIQEVEEYVNNHISSEIIDKTRQRLNNIELIVNRGGMSLALIESELESRVARLNDTNNQILLAQQDLVFGERNLTSAEQVLSEALDDVTEALRALDSICHVNDCREISIEVEECQVCFGYVNREVMREGCEEPIIVLDEITQECCESIDEVRPNVICIIECRRNRMLALAHLQQSKDQAAELFQMFKESQRFVNLARINLERLKTGRNISEQARDQIIAAYESAKNSHELNINNQMTMMTELDRELNIIKLIEMGNTSRELLELVSVSFSERVSETPTSLVIPLTFTYNIPVTENRIQQTIVVNFSSPVNVTLRKIAESIVHKLLDNNTELSMPRRKRQSDTESDLKQHIYLHHELRPHIYQSGIKFINSSPRVQGNRVEVDFTMKQSSSKVTCQLKGRKKQDCSSRSVVYSDLSPGRYFVRVQASNAKEDRAIERRNFEIPSGPDYCTLHLINDGITVSENDVTVEFAGVGPAESFECQLDKRDKFKCDTPVKLSDVDGGDHQLRITPKGCGPSRRLTYEFNV